MRFDFIRGIEDDGHGPAGKNGDMESDRSSVNYYGAFKAFK